MKISAVTTLYHSEPYVSEFYRRIVKAIKEVSDDYEIVFVNDGSPDNALNEALALQKHDKNVVVIDLSRNFGHHRAIATGLKYSTGDYVFLIDSDLEEEPELFLLFWHEKQVNPQYDVLYGVQKKRKGGIVERVTGFLWYVIFSQLAEIDYPPNTTTARLMSRRYVDAVLSFSEKELELWGVFVLAGFEQKPVYVPKKDKGSTTYTLAKKMAVIVNSITSFTSKPLIFLFLAGIIIIIFSSIFIVYLVMQKLLYNQTIEGWTSTLASIWFIGGLIIFSLGIIGIYLAKMFLEIKNRPLSIVRKVYRVSDELDT